MTTKKTTTKAAEKKTATKSAASKTTAAKKTTTKKAAATKAATAVAEPIAPTVTEKLVATMMPETPTTEVAMEAVVAKAAPQTTAAPVVAEKKIVLTIGMLQKRLTDLGIYDGSWDGVYGPMTKHAVARFQAKNGLAVNGDSNAETLKALGLDLYKTY